MKTGLKIRERAYLWNFWCLLLTPSLGWMLGVKVSGHLSMAWNHDPVSVETCCCGTPIHLRIDGCSTGQDKTCNAVRMQQDCKDAVCSVACLAWAGWIRHPRVYVTAMTLPVLACETRPAKEAKSTGSCRGNHLGCRNWAGRGLQYGLSGNSVPESVTTRHRP